MGLNITMIIVLISSLVHPNLPARVKLSACHGASTDATQLGVGLEPTQAHFQQHSHLDDLLLETRTWRRREQGKGRAAEAYLSTKFEAVRGVHNENMHYVFLFYLQLLQFLIPMQSACVVSGKYNHPFN